VLKFPNFRYRGNKGWFQLNSNKAVKWRDPENPGLMQVFWPYTHKKYFLAEL